MFNKKKKQLVVAVEDFIKSTIKNEVDRKMEATIQLKQWQSQYVECEKCGVLVNKDKAIPDTKIVYRLRQAMLARGIPYWGEEEPTSELIYYCQRCNAQRKEKEDKTPSKKVDK